MIFTAPKAFSLHAVCHTSMLEVADTPDYPQQAEHKINVPDTN